MERPVNDPVNVLEDARKFANARGKRRSWYRVVTGLACVVVFCTVYALILPAITLEEPTFCGMEEHTHTVECYTRVTTVEQKVLVCDGENPALAQADYVLHHHDATCYDSDGNLCCTLPEVSAHVHGESCYTVPETEPPHVHTEACYTRERGELICTESTEPVHLHTEECYTESRELACGQEEWDGHTHGEGCFDENGELICDLEETQGHHHEEGCYRVNRELICGLTEEPAHMHSDDCYQWTETLSCGLSDEPVETEPPEPVLTCGREELVLHEHTADCYDESGSLICGKPQVLAHQHTDACFETVEVPADTETLTCGIPEGEGAHTHGPECYDEEGNLTCHLEESQGHRHTELCYGTWLLVCEQPEHTHTAACYSDSEADVETREQWEQTFADVRLTGDWRQDVLAIAKTQLGYTESTRNYAVWEDGSQHGYTRYGDWYGSPYGDWCAMFVSFCIHYADVEGMPLNWGCRTWIADLEPLDRYRLAASDYTPVPGDLIFYDWELDGLSDHVGLVAELVPASGEEPAKLIAIEGNSSNRVQYVTYEQDDPVILGYGQLPEQTFYCGKTGHVHTRECGSDCALEEHIHTDDCLVPVEEEILTELTFEGPDYTVSVRYGADAELPEGVVLEVSEIPGDSGEYQNYLSQTSAAMEAAGQTDTVVFARFFDIRFLLDGEALEPAAPVEVTITYAEAVETDEDSNCQAVHFAEEGTEILDVTTQQQEDGSTSFTHTQSGFSVVGDVVTVSAAKNPADTGPDRLPVDYYVCIDGVWTCVGSTKTGWYFVGDGSLTNHNRDYITVEQAVSILEPYGFTGTEENPSLVTAYQQKSGHTNVYSDTDTVMHPENDENGTRILPLSRNTDHAGYNLYYLPNNAAPINGVSSPEGLDKTANGFYTVKVFDAQGVLVKSSVVLTGESFEYEYDVSETDVTSWLVVRGDTTSVETFSDGIIRIENITTPITVSPNPGGDVGSHSVTFKVMIDGQWKTVGSLPYYYSGDVNGSQRAYITSAMAAQMFGDFGYTATTAPGYQFGYSYNDIYTLFYANGSTQTNYCMDVAGGTLQEAQAIQLYKSNGSNAQVFRIWDAGGGYSFITPIGNSNYHVNVYGYTTGDPSSTQLKLSSATNANSQWKVDTGSDGRTTFWSAIAPDDQVIDLNNADMSNGGRLQIWHSTGGARYWYMVQQYRISNNTVSAENSDGTWNIGLTTESNGDIVCYYLPGETGHAYTDKTESDIDGKNSCWSVTVRDDSHWVYSEGELSSMVQYVSGGGQATVTVENADGILWSCTGKNGQPVEMESTQSDGNTTFVITNITQPIEVMATKADPGFTVQYYANIARFATSGETTLTVIDTSADANGGKATLPWNGGNMATKNLYLEGIGQNTNQNNGNSTPLYRIKTTMELTKLYSDKECRFATEPGLEYFNKLKDNSDYVLAEIWVLKTGEDAASTNQDDWDIYQWNENTAFTNEAGQALGDTILIQDGAVIRLVFDSSAEDYHNGTTFYDYNISSGQNADGRWRTGITGINSKENYGTSLNKERNWNSGVDVLAFGNANCGTGMALYQFDGGTLNKYNAKNSNYGGATFKIADGLNSDGTIRYNKWIVAPKLFNDGDAQYKQTYSGSSLTFDRVGDTYTLSSATLANSNGQSNTISGLQYFFNPSPYGGTVHTHIFTNNFWPMDAAAGRTDGLWGTYGNPGKFQGFTEGGSPTNGWSANASDFPYGDDGRAHNWFFGMNFALSFSLTEDYEGPLEYYFFGDDDLWVFLDQTLICDIGGVHSSIGEYVNLRDYLPVGSSGQHTLSFFYTERGDTGSTCYMSFTLPSVSSATTSRNTGSLQIAKSLDGVDGLDFSGEKYQFKVELLTSENGSGLNQTFSFSRSDGTYGTIRSGGTITLHQDENVTISGIPAGTFYRVTELTTQGYHTTVNDNEGYIVSGKIETGAIKPASFVNRPYMELPNTGGAGTTLYTIGGLLLMTAAAFLLLYIHNRRRKEDAVSS